MTLHWDVKHSKDITALALITVVAAMTALVGLAWGINARGPVLIAQRSRVSDGAKGLAEAAGNLQFRVFNSKAGDYSFEAPGEWARTPDPQGPTREAFFVGPLDRARQTVVFLSVSCSPQTGETVSIEELIAQLQLESQLDRQKEILTNEPILVDQRPARLFTVRQQVDGPEFTLTQSDVFLADGGDLYILEYVASSELYEAYLPVFDRLVTSFHFHREWRE